MIENKLTLHEAIIKVLRQKGRPMSTQEIADELNKNGLYSKKDGSTITAFQIHGRTRNYDHLFHRDGSIVSLKANKPLPIPSHPSAQITQSQSRPITQVVPLPAPPLRSVAAPLKSPNRPIAEFFQPPIQLRHDFNEIDYIPANDRIRFTIHPDARKEVLKRLLQLSHQYFEQEAFEGKHKEETLRKFYEQKGTPIPAEASKWFKKGKAYKNPKTQKPSVKELDQG